MGKDRQESKQKAATTLHADRDQELSKKGATKMSGPKEARLLNNNKL